MAFSASIVIFYVDTQLYKGHVFQLNIAELRITVVYWQPNNRYCKLCVIPLIYNYYISLKIKLLPPLSKRKLLLIHTSIFKNDQK